jgi:carboxylesterase
MTVHIEDFAWLWQGKLQRELTQDELHYLLPVEQKNTALCHRALIMIHGFSSSPAVFRTIMPHLTGYDAVFAPLLPGHGENLAAFAQVTAHDWMTAVMKTFQAVRSQYERVDVLGLSLGGLLASMLAQRVEVDHLFLLAPALALKFPMSMGPWIPRGLSMLGCNSIRSQGGNLYRHDENELVYRRLPWSAIAEILGLVHQFCWKPVATPIDLCLGKYDIVIHNEHVQKALKHQKKLNIHVLENSAHVLPLDGDQDKIIQILTQHQQSQDF